MGVIGWLRSKFSRKPEKPLTAFVWLLDRPRTMDAETVKRVVERALGIIFPPPSDDAMEFVIGETPSFMVKLKDYMLLVNCLPVPYVKDREREAKGVRELRAQKVVREHEAWVSADLFGDYEGAALEDGWRIIGRIAAQFAQDDCMALFVPATNQLIPYDPELLDQLRSDDPLKELSWQVSPVAQVSGDDSEMKAAVEEARRRWPEFVQAFRAPKPGQESFAVKLPITDGRHTEFIWVEVASVDADEILGDLANEPVDLQFMKLGDRVRGKLADLNDWVYMDNGEMVGGFTSRVLMARS